MQISLIEFSLENFKAFKNKATFSMVARKNEKYTFEINDENLLKTSLIYGPNASGKTSILEAFDHMKKFILLSANIPENQEKKNLPHFPFLASESSKNNPTSFEVIFALLGDHNGIYKYSFGVLQDHIVSEKLIEISSTGKETEYLSRSEQKITVDHNFKDMKSLLGKIRRESLFLSTSAQLNNSFALSLINAFNSIITVSGIFTNAQQFTAKKFKTDSEYKEKILSMLKTADFCITGGGTEEVEFQGFGIKNDSGKVSFEQTKGKDDMLFFEHPVFDSNNNKTDTFKLKLFQESIGTQKFLSILGPVIDALENGKVILVDEFDNSLHPLLTKFIVDLFSSEQMNEKNAQFIATTHDTSLLSYRDDFLRDQFWFTEKDEQGSAKLFSLAEFSMRNDTEYSRKYLEGRFGALPFIGSIKK
ncbi:ATP-binding protein [Candidatus Nomurabacteria bacterium]|nr:ATP-binding protein [Candidatus Nomurabacteria bacterium]